MLKKVLKLSNNSCYECQKRHPGCHGRCSIYRKYRNEINKVKKNREEDLVYRNYKREKTISTSKVARPYEHRGFSSI